jgi:hypothetical protein
MPALGGDPGPATPRPTHNGSDVSWHSHVVLLCMGSYLPEPTNQIETAWPERLMAAVLVPR